MANSKDVQFQGEWPSPLMGLVIDEPWISKILRGEKTWEMRSMPTKNRGLIALIRKGSGMVVGVVELTGVGSPLTDQELDKSVGLHHVTRAFRDATQGYKWYTPWKLRNAIPLEQAVPYKHKPGAVIFITLSEEESQQIKAQVLAVESVDHNSGART